MILRNLRSILISACVFTFSFSGAQADSMSALTLQEELKIQTERFNLIPEEFLENSSDNRAEFAFRAYDDGQYLYRIHSYAYHHPVAITATGDNLQLHDASLWFVHPSYRYLVKKWVTSDQLFIKPNASCFSLYSYVIQNRVTQDVVEVSLINPPIDTGAYTHWIIDIDYFNRLVYLNDGTTWSINPSDYAFSKWKIGHRLMIGVNNKWRSAPYPHVLINTSIYKAPYCEANVYQ